MCSLLKYRTEKHEEISMEGSGWKKNGKQIV